MFSEHIFFRDQIDADAITIDPKLAFGSNKVVIAASTGVSQASVQNTCFKYKLSFSINADQV